MKERSHIAAEIHAARDQLVATVRGLTADQWDAPSLCDEWTVKDVVAHVVRVGDYYRAPATAVVGVARHRFSINRFLAEDAKGYAHRRDTTELIEALEEARYEDTRAWRRHPAPAMGLGEWVVHGQDIRRPLGLAHEIPISQLELIVDVMSAKLRYPWGAPRRPPARFEATDCDWASGDGPVVRGPLEAIVMVVAGRNDALKDLSGDVTALR